MKGRSQWLGHEAAVVIVLATLLLVTAAIVVISVLFDDSPPETLPPSPGSHESSSVIDFELLPLDPSVSTASLVFSTGAPGGEILHITPDHRIIITGDIYDAAVEFFEVLRVIAAESGVTLERKEGSGE